MTVSNKYQFGGNREVAIQRDNEKCINCGMTRNEHRRLFKRDITVDHIDGNGRNTPPLLRNNDLSNLQTLCLPCHGRKDINRRLNKDGYARRDAKQIEFNGQSKTFAEWSLEANCSFSAFKARYYTRKWDFDKCLNGVNGGKQ